VPGAAGRRQATAIAERAENLAASIVTIRRAEDQARALAADRGVRPARLVVRPTGRQHVAHVMDHTPADSGASAPSIGVRRAAR